MVVNKERGLKMILSGVITLGRDVELKYAQSGTAVAQLNGAYNTGYGQQKESHWLRATVFGKQAEGLAPHLKKGTKLFISGKDVKVNTYTKQNGEHGASLECIVSTIDFVGGGQQAQQQGQQQGQSQGQYVQPNGQAMNPQQVQNQMAQKAQQPQHGFDNIDVPF